MPNRRAVYTVKARPFDFSQSTTSSYNNEKNGYLYEFNSMEGLIAKIKQFEKDDQEVIFRKKVNMKIYSRNFSILKFYKNFIKYV